MSSLQSTSESSAAFARISSLLPVSSSAVFRDATLWPPQLLAAEHELARDPSSLSRWFAHIRGVEESILREQLDARTETIEDETFHALMGPRLSTAVGRRSLQRIVDVYERALSHHPRSYKLWAQYLRTRAPYVIGTPSQPFNQAASKKRKQAEFAGGEMWEWLQTDQAKGADSDRDIDYGPWIGALDPVVGIDEWRALAAAYERAIVWCPTVRHFDAARAHARRCLDSGSATSHSSFIRPVLQH